VATRVAYANTHAMLRHPERGLDDFVLVSDEAMEEAIVLLLEHTKNLAEHAGAAALAGACGNATASPARRSSWSSAAATCRSRPSPEY
jgi:threonine dehydratase